MTWEQSVCQVSGSRAIANIGDYVVTGNEVALSPIDAFYENTDEILTKVDPAYFDNYTGRVSALLYIGLISATENYLRDVLGAVLNFCPIARMKSAGEKIQLGSLLWGDGGSHTRSAFEFIAFSSSKNIREVVKNFTDYVPKQHGVFTAMLEEFDKLCELRHGIAHSGRLLSGKNALRLGLPPEKGYIEVKPSYATIQEAGDICTTLVQAANNELFEEIAMRWAQAWRRLSSWEERDSMIALKGIFDTFYSRRDHERGAISNAITFDKFADELCATQNLPPPSPDAVERLRIASA